MHEENLVKEAKKHFQLNLQDKLHIIPNKIQDNFQKLM